MILQKRKYSTHDLQGAQTFNNFVYQYNTKCLTYPTMCKYTLYPIFKFVQIVLYSVYVERQEDVLAARKHGVKRVIKNIMIYS